MDIPQIDIPYRSLDFITPSARRFFTEIEARLLVNLSAPSFLFRLGNSASGPFSKCFKKFKSLEKTSPSIFAEMDGWMFSPFLFLLFSFSVSILFQVSCCLGELLNNSVLSIFNFKRLFFEEIFYLEKNPIYSLCNN